MRPITTGGMLNAVFDIKITNCRPKNLLVARRAPAGIPKRSAKKTAEQLTLTDRNIIL